MKFKTDKSLVCEVCGKPIKYRVLPDEKAILYLCTNPDCGNGKEVTKVAHDTWPEWVSMRYPKKIWSE